MSSCKIYYDPLHCDNGVNGVTYYKKSVFTCVDYKKNHGHDMFFFCLKILVSCRAIPKSTYRTFHVHVNYMQYVICYPFEIVSSALGTRESITVLCRRYRNVKDDKLTCFVYHGVFWYRATLNAGESCVKSSERKIIDRRK